MRMRGKGQLTDKTIKLLTRYFGKAISPTPLTVWQCRMMSGRCFTTPSPQTAVHSTSCPSGQRSWCKFNRALANSEPSSSHSSTIHPDIVPPLKKVFEQLSHPTLMERCVLGATQNRNGSFNSTIWQRCLKTEFCFATTVEIAFNLAVIPFNSGQVPFANSRKGCRSLFLPSRGSIFLTWTITGCLHQ